MTAAKQAPKASSPKASSEAEIAARIADAAARALKEAEERRAHTPAAPDKPAEINGPKGPEPTRYGDWERKGIVSDF